MAFEASEIDTGVGTRIITCMAADKRRHCRPDDILVDDTLKHRDLQEAAGGTFMHHRDADSTLRALHRLRPSLLPGEEMEVGSGGFSASTPPHG